MKIPLTIPLFLASQLLAQAPEGEFKVRLTAPLNTRLSRAGDMVVGKIVAPAEFAGGYLEGDVREVHAGASGKRSLLYFQFHSLHASGKVTRVGAVVIKIVNSRQQADIDEDGAGLEEDRGGGAFGAISRMSSNVRSRIGSKGVEKPAAGGALTRLTSKAPNLSLAPGSELTVQLTPPTKK